ncbi:putative protein C7orf43 [Liparis tanakae]|uniref:Uncharacterized protein n=1 Tax=Liparis tanakae TaxID=230148 RepID=A0A4Z2FV94_9TELE|nr:putative protein C7orf43 [Liparis tanakae]
MDGESSSLPSTLSALEEHNFLFQLQLQDKARGDSSEVLTVRYISSCYSLPSIRLERPLLVMTASCPRAVRPLEPFWVKYTLLNNLQDFLAVRLIWSSDARHDVYHDTLNLFPLHRLLLGRFELLPLI